MTTDVREQVRERYAEAASSLSAGCGCGCDCESIGCCGEEATTLFGQGLYGADERAGLPENAVDGEPRLWQPARAGRAPRGRDRARPRLGRRDRRAPLREARRADGHRVRARHDRRDARARARRTPRRRARRTSTSSRASSRRSRSPTESVDVVISNCVVNLSPEKDRVLAEIARVLRPGGRIGISDVVAEDRLSRADRAERGSHVGCIAGALSVSEYRDGLDARRPRGHRGRADARGRADGMHGAIVRAHKPA